MMSHGGTRAECSVCGESQVGEGGGGMQERGRGEPRHCPPPAHSLELTAHPAQPIAAWVPPPALRTELATTLPLLHSYSYLPLVAR